jgi:hypothetical protein
MKFLLDVSIVDARLRRVNDLTTSDLWRDCKTAMKTGDGAARSALIMNTQPLIHNTQGAIPLFLRFSVDTTIAS